MKNRVLLHHQKGFLSLLGVILGLALLVVVSLSLVSLFGGRASQVPKTFSQSQALISQQISPTLLMDSKKTKANESKPDSKYVPGELIVKFKQGVSIDANKRITSSHSFNTLLASIQVTDFRPTLVLPDNKKLEDIPVLNRYYTIKVSKDTDIEALAKKFMQSPDVELAKPNYFSHIIPLNTQ